MNREVEAARDPGHLLLPEAIGDGGHPGLRPPVAQPSRSSNAYGSNAFVARVARRDPQGPVRDVGHHPEHDRARLGSLGRIGMHADILPLRSVIPEQRAGVGHGPLLAVCGQRAHPGQAAPRPVRAGRAHGRDGAVERVVRVGSRVAQVGRGRAGRLEQCGLAVGERIAVGVPAGRAPASSRSSHASSRSRASSALRATNMRGTPGRSSVAVSDIAPREVPVAFIPTSGTPDATTGETTADAALGLVDHDRDAVGVGRVPLFLVHQDRAVGAAEQRVGAALDRRAHRLGVEHAVELLERVRRAKGHRVDTGALGHPLEQLHQVGHDAGADLVVGGRAVPRPGCDRRRGRPPTTS